MILKNLIYIYQLEYYSKKRFFAFVYKKTNWLHLSKRGKLDWTARSILVYTLSILFLVVLILVAILYYNLLSAIIIAICFVVFLPLIIVMADILISPLVILQRNRITKKARKIIEDQKKLGLKTIGITGSFGKTSMKNILTGVLREKYKIFTFPGNINTDVGVASYIIKNKKELDESEVLVAEMGAHKRGEIKNLCNIVSPQYGIITSIGECHLDRFGSLKNIISTKFELANLAEEKVFLNVCNDNVKNNADKEIKTNVKVGKICGSQEVQNKKYLDNFAGISFEYQKNIFTIKIIADYVIDFATIAFAVAEELGLSDKDMQAGLEKMEPVPHRLEVIRNNALDRTIIDDSYNGNVAGFMAGLDILDRAQGRKVVLTPGIVELGGESQTTHEQLAEKYSQKADLALLIKNRNTDFIVEKFKELGYNSFKVYKTAKKAHQDLENVLKNGDTIIFQNDLSDNY